MQKLTERPFRYRSGCHLQAKKITCNLDGEDIAFPDVNIKAAIAAAGFEDKRSPTEIEYPAQELYRVEDPKAKNKAKKEDNDTGQDEVE